MKQKIVLVSAFIAAGFLMSGCGSSNTSSSGEIAKGTALYLDSAVEGVSVDCAGQVSVTDEKGQFTFSEGQTCQFTIGDIVLRQESNIAQDQIIIEDDIRTAQFLQSMDFDGNAENGITIHAETAAVMKEHGISHVPDSDQEIADCVEYMEEAKIGYYGDFVSAAQAREHFLKTKEAFKDMLP